MKINRNVKITGNSVTLVPYRQEHVSWYHSWMVRTSGHSCSRSYVQSLTVATLAPVLLTAVFAFVQQDPKLQEATASEPLTLQASYVAMSPLFSTDNESPATLQEEYAMQLSWCEDADSEIAY